MARFGMGGGSVRDRLAARHPIRLGASKWRFQSIGAN